MAKISLTTGGSGELVHARTTGGSEESQVAVIGIDGSDSVVPADATAGLRVNVHRPATAAQTNVSAATSSQTLKALNTARIGLSVFNDSTANLFISYSGAASTSNFAVKIPAGGHWEEPYGFTGAVTGIWDAANGAARVLELTV